MHHPSVLRQALALCLTWLLLVSQAWGATSKQFVLPGTGIVFADSGGDRVLVFASVATANGRVSAQYDKDPLKDPVTGAMPALWYAMCQVSFNGTPTLGIVGAEFYIAHADAAGTTVDGGVGTASATITSDQRRPLTFMGTLPVYNTTANTVLYASFRNIYIPGRYFSVAWFNTSGVTATSPGSAKCTMYPVPFQMQGS